LYLANKQETSHSYHLYGKSNISITLFLLCLVGAVQS